MSFSKNKIVGLLILGIFIAFGIIWKYQIAKYSMPSFKLHTVNNITITNQDLSNFRIFIYLTYNLSSFSKKLIKDIAEVLDPNIERLVVVFNHGTISEKTVNKEGIFFVKTIIWQSFEKLFNLKDSSSSKILIYDKNSNLVTTLDGPRSNMIKVLNIIKNPVELSRGDITKISTYIDKEYSTHSDGVYFISDNIIGPCFSRHVYDYIEKQSKIHNGRFELHLCGNPTEIEVENLKKEVNSTVIVNKVKQDIDDIIREWKRQTRRNKFDMIVVKKSDFVKSFPIIDSSDFEVLKAHHDQLMVLFLN